MTSSQYNTSLIHYEYLISVMVLAPVMEELTIAVQVAVEQQKMRRLHLVNWHDQLVQEL